ncbi:Fe(3+) ABC transporter substrate-binding protein [Agarilytica rhodophyticola]|uniref:Fe(3+) ABC transporter substrate-binding protein n=1 Tax=Agarilytica rhodophyticola TaxID=1737490 RepID=UPI000B341A39|nr:Fe(3+) ABC transporter substrate-binding protein [Agarilytica rhodophyticola]
MQKFIFYLLSSALFILSCDSYSAPQEVNVYSARKEALIKPLLDRFTKQTNIKVNLVTGKGDALLTRLKAEGPRSPADVLITSDVGRLFRAKQAKVLQPVAIPALDSIVKPQYRDSDNYWYGLSLRSRVMVYAKDRVKASELSNYEVLADDKWRARICVRSSDNIYNQSLVASFIAHQGLPETETWIKKFVANLGRPPRGGDRDQVKAIVAGQCDVAIINSYYLGAMLNSENFAEKKIAQQVALFWPNQTNRGSHMNVSGIGITQAASNKANAIKLIEFLLTEESQSWYASINHEFPVREGVKVSDTLNSWGEFKADDIPLEKLGELNAQAVKAMDRNGWK